MKTHALTIKIGAKKLKNVRNCESAVSGKGGVGLSAVRRTVKI